MKNSLIFFNKFKYALLILIFLNSCSALKYKQSNVKDNPVNEAERVAKNMEEGKGFKLFDDKKKGGVFQFASSNPLWRASIEVLDFIPLTNASYSGGIIITDWYSQAGPNDESIKITVRFLSNQIRSDALSISVYKKKCKAYENCETINGDGTINQEIKLAILKRATQLKKSDFAKKKN
jgi:hypothetical protein